MRWKFLVDALARRPEGLVVLGGLAALLSGVERLMSWPDASAQRWEHRRRSTSGAASRKRKNFFSIKQTRSELGYVFWVLQGHGDFRSFELFDTWSEAVAAADARLTRTDAYVLS